MNLRVDVIEDADALSFEALERWFALAERSGSPYATPAWTLGVWRALRGDVERLAVVLVSDGDELLGVGPFCGNAARHRLGSARWWVAGSGIGQRIAPLARADAAREVAAAFAAVLAPRASAVSFDATASSSRLPALIADAWPARGLRPRIVVDRSAPGLLTSTAAGFDQWRAARTRNYRRQQVRRRREIEARGGVIRRSRGRDQLGADLAAMFRLHGLRFAASGRSTSLERYRSAVLAACLDLMDRRDRTRLWVIEAGGEVVAAQLFLALGPRMCAWNGGFDPAWDAASPGLVLYDEGIRDAHELGAEVLDWGAGDQPHKRHVADVEEAIDWTVLFARDRRYPATRMAFAPEQARGAARRLAHRLPADQQERLKRLLRR
jgi:CelD/BcsL family acetyltransferase involved in cellulose biosynthesis